MACISAATGTMTFAVINLVMVTISTAIGAGFLGFWCYSTFYAYQEYYGPGMEDHSQIYSNILQVGAIVAFLGMSLICLMFSSFLMNGILKKNAAHIKVYYIFGVVKTIISFFIFAAVCFSAVGIQPAPVCLVLLCYLIYSLILYMIRRTYLQYEANTDQFGHKPLVEKC